MNTRTHVHTRIANCCDEREQSTDRAGPVRSSEIGNKQTKQLVCCIHRHGREVLSKWLAVPATRRWFCCSFDNFRSRWWWWWRWLFWVRLVLRMNFFGGFCRNVNFTQYRPACPKKITHKYTHDRMRPTCWTVNERLSYNRFMDFLFFSRFKSHSSTSTVDFCAHTIQTNVYMEPWNIDNGLYARRVSVCVHGCMIHVMWYVYCTRGAHPSSMCLYKNTTLTHMHTC